MAPKSKNGKKKYKSSNVLPMPVNDVKSLLLGADTLESQLWNLSVTELFAGMPLVMILGILDKVKAELLECTGEEG
jgi:hypothetical protein